MEITKYYTQKSRVKSWLDTSKIKSKSGHEFYLTQRTFSYVAKNSGISFLELISSLYKDSGEFVLPLNVMINASYRKISHNICTLRNYDYLKSERKIASMEQEDLYYKIKELHKGLKIVSKLPPVFEHKKYKVPLRALSFDEMIKQSSLSLAITAPFLTWPQIIPKLARTTGYTEKTIGMTFSALGYLRLLERENNRYSLTSNPEKRQDILALIKECQRNKEKYANKLRRHVTAIEMIGKKEKFSDISFSTGYSVSHLSKIASEKPTFNFKIAEILLSEGILCADEFEKLENLGLLRQPETV
jgi:hypothetical protein